MESYEINSILDTLRQTISDFLQFESAESLTETVQAIVEDEAGN